MPRDDLALPPEGARVFESEFTARSYELDSFGHVNHAVYFNYFEQARFEAFAAGGFSPSELERHGWGIHLVSARAEYHAELKLGQRVRVTTWLGEGRRSSMRFHHAAYDPDDLDRVFATGTVVAVWIGPDGRPMRVPEEARSALGGAPR